jgi:hypothetical protein
MASDSVIDKGTLVSQSMNNNCESLIKLSIVRDGKVHAKVNIEIITNIYCAKSQFSRYDFEFYFSWITSENKVSVHGI